jgi:Domain of unknown function (DUF5655)
MAGHTCYHCKQWVEDGVEHDCWTTTESALTADLSEDLREAWERLRETLGELGDQRVYASHNSIMFSRRACYCFVRPKRTALELCIFLGRTVRGAQVRRAIAASARKIAHLVHITHRDQVESPITDWLREAYETSDALSARSPKAATPARTARQRARKTPVRKGSAGQKTTRQKTTRQKTTSQKTASQKTTSRKRGAAATARARPRARKRR